MIVPAIPNHNDEWTIIIHERNHYINNAYYKYGSAYSYTSLIGRNKSVMVLYEVRKEVVTYLNDERTPCQTKMREEEINTCIHRHIENRMGCQLPWHNKSTTLPRCIDFEQYQEFLNSYYHISNLNEASIAKETGCLPSCKRVEFKLKVVNQMLIPVMSGQIRLFGAMFYYPSGAYKKRSYYYTYELSDYIADIGGYMGLLLGCSLLSFYDWLKNMCKKILKLIMKKKYPRKSLPVSTQTAIITKWP